MRIYLGNYKHVYFAKERGGDWYCFDSDIVPNPKTLQLCRCSFGYYEEQTAWDKAIELSEEDNKNFERWFNLDDNYDVICGLIKKYIPELSQEDLDNMLDYHPDMIELTKKFWSPDEFDFKGMYHAVQSYMRTWNNDVERVTEYMNKVVVPKEKSRAICRPMIDVWDEDSRRARLYREFFDGCSFFDDICDVIIQEAVDKFPAENDFDKRYYYVAEKFHTFKEERLKALREKGKKVKEG
jgi:hypothetical protein